MMQLGKFLGIPNEIIDEMMIEIKSKNDGKINMDQWIN